MTSQVTCTHIRKCVPVQSITGLLRKTFYYYHYHGYNDISRYNGTENSQKLQKHESSNVKSFFKTAPHLSQSPITLLLSHGLLLSSKRLSNVQFLSETLLSNKRGAENKTSLAPSALQGDFILKAQNNNTNTLQSPNVTYVQMVYFHCLCAECLCIQEVVSLSQTSGPGDKQMLAHRKADNSQNYPIFSANL